MISLLETFLFEVGGPGNETGFTCDTTCSLVATLVPEHFHESLLSTKAEMAHHKRRKKRKRNLPSPNPLFTGRVPQSSVA